MLNEFVSLFLLGLYCLQVLMLKELRKGKEKDIEEDDENLNMLPITNAKGYTNFKQKLKEVEGLKKKLVSLHHRVRSVLLTLWFT